MGPTTLKPSSAYARISQATDPSMTSLKLCILITSPTLLEYQFKPSEKLGGSLDKFSNSRFSQLKLEFDQETFYR